MWLLYAILSSVFASLMTIFMKVSLKNLSATVSLALRTSLVVVFCWFLVIIERKTPEIKSLTKKDYIYLVLSALATFGTWVFYFLALKNGATSKVLAIDRFSIVLTIILSFFILKEVITLKMIIGIAIIILGTVLVVF